LWRYVESDISRMLVIPRKREIRLRRKPDQRHKNGRVKYRLSVQGINQETVVGCDVYNRLQAQLTLISVSEAGLSKL
jgi:hypothetical protein